MCAQKQMAALFVLWLGGWLTHILHSLPLLGIRLRYQFSNMHRAHLSPLFELHWLWGGGGVTYHIFFITQLASDDLMIFPAAATAAAPSYRGKRCGELLRCLTPVTFYYFTVINLARMQTLY
jgi:hypothetical protein